MSAATLPRPAWKCLHRTSTRTIQGAVSLLAFALIAASPCAAH